ncbi:MAG: ABC transporter permease [Phycisphaerales bacterium]|nr:ABC transporter permease [Phycisphaerales bacterium]
MMQTLAILHDAYRELNARKLFWFVLVISGVVVGAFAAIGINDEGLTIFFWTIRLPFTTAIMSEEMFYKLMFVNLGIGFWLGWIATILALVSTAGIIPDFISGGSIDLILSKPIGRLRLYLTKYIAGLLFVTLQVAVFSIASYLVIGIRGNAWEPGLFMAVPIVVCFYSYLFCVCTLLGLLTRSTMAALLLTLLFWFFTFSLNTTENVVLMGRLFSDREIAGRVEELDRFRGQLVEGSQTPQQERLRERIDDRENDLEHAREIGARWVKAHRISFAVKTSLPKTAETIDLLERVLVSSAELEAVAEADDSGGAVMTFGSGGRYVDQAALQMDLIEELRRRSVWWIVGTSLGFEAVVLAIGGWFFCRRDF